MSDETNYERSKVPQLKEHSITDWLDEFKGYLMRHKRAHLAIENERPTQDASKMARIARRANPEKALRRYLLELKEEQKDWDERNDIAISNLIDSTKDAANSEARQMIFDKFKLNLPAKDICSALVARFHSVDPRVVNAEIRRWTSLKIIPGERATSFITRLKEVKENLRKKGKTFTDGELVGRLLDGLKEEPRYAMSVAAMETVKDLTWENAVTQLQTKDTAEFLDSNATTETAAMATVPPTPSTRQNSGGNERCQICKKSGHNAAICRFRYEKKSEDTSKIKRKENGNLKIKKDKKNIKCFKCGKQGHYANECRESTSGKGNAKRTKEERNTEKGDPDPKRFKNNDLDGSRGAWDKDEFSGMMRERS